MTHTYLIASSVGGSILSIFREQEGERVQCSLWSIVVDPDQLTTLKFYDQESVTFRRGLVVNMSRLCTNIALIPDKDYAARSVRMKSDQPIHSVQVSKFDEYPINEPPAPSKPAPAPKAKPAAKAKPAKPKRDTRKPLTDKQREIVDSLKAYQDLHGFSPTYAELQERLGYKYPANIQQHVRLLKKKGYVSANHGKHRSLSLV